MVYKDPHLSDQQLLLAADGELSSHRQNEIRQHLQSCWTCRARMAKIEGTIVEFVGSYESLLNSEMPPGNGSEAVLKARLITESSGSRSARPVGWATPLFGLSLAILSVVGLLLWRQDFRYEPGIVPNPRLTPGETMAVSKADLCHARARSESVPEALKEAVFSEYGMKNAPRNAYEVDFLITPELGGSASLRNLWPEPYHEQSWNAHVKDVLEERLHSLVCNGELELSTAQREIATNWVGAYEKYVSVNRP